MPVMMLAGVESGSETAASLSAHYRRRRALFDPTQTFDPNPAIRQLYNVQRSST